MRSAERLPPLSIYDGCVADCHLRQGDCQRAGEAYVGTDQQGAVHDQQQFTHVRVSDRRLFSRPLVTTRLYRRDDGSRADADHPRCGTLGTLFRQQPALALHLWSARHARIRGDPRSSRSRQPALGQKCRRPDDHRFEELSGFIKRRTQARLYAFLRYGRGVVFGDLPGHEARLSRAWDGRVRQGKSRRCA